MTLRFASSILLALLATACAHSPTTATDENLRAEQAVRVLDEVMQMPEKAIPRSLLHDAYAVTRREAGTEASHAISETAGPTLTVTAETKLSFPDAVVPSALKSSTSG